MANLTGELQLDFMPIERRDLVVARVESITPHYRRVVLAGADLDRGFPFAPFAPGDHVKAYFPDPETGVIAAYRLPEDEDGEWELDVEGGEPIHRDYTVRSWDPDARELSFDFVVHGHGTASDWVQDAQPGDRLTIFGPSANWHLPQNYGDYLAIGDATALPGIARIVEEAPPGSHVMAVIEVASAEDELVLEPGPRVTVDLVWVHRDTAPVLDGHSGPLETAVRALPLPVDLGDLFVWAAGEAGDIRPIRRYLRNEVGLPKRQTHVDGYWKRGVVNHDHHDEDLNE